MTLFSQIVLVVDASQGSMVLESARIWSSTVGVSSLILTKLDGTARGGSVIAVSKELGIPVKLVGVGEVRNCEERRGEMGIS